MEGGRDGGWNQVAPYFTALTPCGAWRRHTSPSVLVPALRTVGNIVTGNDYQTQVRSDNVFVMAVIIVYTHNDQPTPWHCLRHSFLATHTHTHTHTKLQHV